MLVRRLRKGDWLYRRQKISNGVFCLKFRKIDTLMASIMILFKSFQCSRPIIFLALMAVLTTLRLGGGCKALLENVKKCLKMMRQVGTHWLSMRGEARGTSRCRRNASGKEGGGGEA